MLIIIPQRETVPPPKSQRRGTHHQNMAGHYHERSSFFRAILHHCFQIASRAFTATQPVANIPSCMKPDRQGKTSRSNSSHSEKQLSNACTEERVLPTISSRLVFKCKYNRHNQLSTPKAEQCFKASERIAVKCQLFPKRQEQESNQSDHPVRETNSGCTNP